MKLVAVIPEPIVVVTEVMAEGAVVAETVEPPPPTKIPYVVWTADDVLVVPAMF